MVAVQALEKRTAELRQKEGGGAAGGAGVANHSYPDNSGKSFGDQ
jgi:hypothetical protein